MQLVSVPKADASARTIPLPRSVATALAAHIEHHGPGNNGAIFHRPDGSLWRRQRVAYALGLSRGRANDAARQSAELAGVEPVLPFAGKGRFHEFQHFYASLLIAKGASVKTVQKRLGHASAVETLDTYGHLWPDSDDETRVAVDDILEARVARAAAV